MNSPLRTLSISVLGLAIAGLVGVSTAGAASAQQSTATSVAVSTPSSGVQLTLDGVGADSWSWGGLRPHGK